MRITTKYAYVGIGFMFILLLVFFSVSYAINIGSAELNTFYPNHVSGTPNFAAPGTESFWSGVPTVTVPLIASSNYPPSGATQEVQAQMAWTSSTPVPELLVKLQFPNYGHGASYSAPSPVYVNNSVAIPPGTVINSSALGSGASPMYQNLSCTNQFSSCFGNVYPQDTGLLPLAVGTNYIYPEQVSVILGMSPGANTDAWYNVSYKPKMVMGTAGALDTGSGGQVEIWTWSSNPTDNSPSDAGYPGLYFPNGTVASTAGFGQPANMSYAIDGYANASAYYQLGGLPYSNHFLYINNPALETNDLSSVGHVSYYMNPYEVQSKGVLNPTTNTWTVEFARALTTPPNNGENNYQLQMNPNNPNNYYVSFEINQGQASETYLLYYGSVSFWWRFNFEHTPGYVGYNQQYGANAVYAMSAILVAITLGTLYERSRKGSSLPHGRMLQA